MTTTRRLIVKRIVVAVVLALVAAYPLTAQERAPVAGEVIDVQVTNLDVVVTDSKGKRVTGLSKDVSEPNRHERSYRWPEDTVEDARASTIRLSLNLDVPQPVATECRSASSTTIPARQGIRE